MDTLRNYRKCKNESEFETLDPLRGSAPHFLWERRLPEGWVAFQHPEGNLYFENHEKVCIEPL